MFTFDVQIGASQPRTTSGTLACSQMSGSAASSKDLTFTATPKAICGWSFVRMVLGIYPYSWSSYEITSESPTYVLHLDGKDKDGHTYSSVTIVAYAVFSFAGSGKLMRSSVQPGKLLCKADPVSGIKKLIRDI